MFTVRESRESDAVGIAKVHVDSWRSTYDGVISASFLKQLSYEQRAEAAMTRIKNPEIDCFVAVNSETNQLVGFADCGASREKNLDVAGELYAIYVLQDVQGEGVGRQLFESAVAALKKRGFKDFFASVISENLGAVQFYEHMGGELTGNDHVLIEARKHPTDTFVWKL